MATGDNQRLAPPRLSQQWPLVGRAEELRFVTLSVTPPRSGVVLVGGPGVGKTRLAKEVAAGADSGGRVVVPIAATEATREAPLGALYHLIGRTPSGIAHPGGVAAELAEVLRLGSDELQPLIVVDDAHLLDDMSASILFQWATTGLAAVLATVRRGEALPAAVTALYKDELVERLDLQPLSRTEVAHLLEAVLGGQLADATLSSLWTASQGNVLYLKELVLDALDAGSLCDHGGVWVWSGGAGPAARLTEVIGARLAGLGPEEAEVMEALSVAGALDARALEEWVGPEPIAALERGGLVESTALGRRTEIRLAHPLYGEVLRVRVGDYRRRSILRRLADRLESTGFRRADDLLRLANWRVASGTPSNAGRLAEAAEQANRLNDALNAEVLARASLQLEPSAAAALQLGGALIDQGRNEQAEAVLSGVDALDLDDASRKALAYQRMRALFYGLGRMEDADRALAGVESVAIADDVRLTIRGWRAMLLSHAGRIQEAADLSTELIESDVAAVRAQGLPNVALARLLAGRVEEAVALIEECLVPGTFPGGPPRMVTALHVLALCCDGRVEDAARTVHSLSAAMEVDRHRPGEVALVDTFRGHVLLMAGRPRSALRALRQAAVVLRSHDAGGFLAWCLSLQVEACALLGDGSGAEAAMDDVRALEGRGGVRMFQGAALRAQAWRLVAAGAPAAAADELVLLAGRLEEGGEVTEAVRCLHDALRLGAPVGAPLAELAGRVEGRLGRNVALHARGRATRSAAEVEQAAAGFAADGCNLLAADAEVDASVLWAGAGLGRRAAAAQERAAALAAGGEGAVTPAQVRATSPARLTDREDQVARLAATGLTNKEIAARLSTSVRTVEGHLQQAYMKMGISSRGALAQRYGPGAAPGR